MWSINTLMVAKRKGRDREFGMLYLKWITNKDLHIAHGTLLNFMWQPIWEGSYGENKYMYMYGWTPLLFTWNYHNIVNQLYPNTKKKFKN